MYTLNKFINTLQIKLHARIHTHTQKIRLACTAPNFVDFIFNPFVVWPEFLVNVNHCLNFLISLISKFFLWKQYVEPIDLNKIYKVCNNFYICTLPNFLQKNIVKFNTNSYLINIPHFFITLHYTAAQSWPFFHQTAFLRGFLGRFWFATPGSGSAGVKLGNLSKY